MPQSATQLDSVHADHVASSTAPCRLPAGVRVSPYIVAEEGYVLAVRAMESKEVYNQIEGTDGQFRPVLEGDVIVGALGERQALKGFSGRVPRVIHPGDVLHVLNLGGILGLATCGHPELGEPLRVEVLGAVVTEDAGRHARIQDHAIEPQEFLSESAPLIVVSGTAMNTGKTCAAAAAVDSLTHKGLRVAAAKLTGASLARDVRLMQEKGAVATASFTDAGVVATTGRDMVPIAKGIIHHLNQASPDVIVLELGDGIIGPYGVDAILQDMELQRHTVAHVVAAADLAGAWAADQLFRTRYRSELAVVVGPATDTETGRRYLQNGLGIPGINACSDAGKLGEFLASKIRLMKETQSDLVHV